MSTHGINIRIPIAGAVTLRDNGNIGTLVAVVSEAFASLAGFFAGRLHEDDDGPPLIHWVGDITLELSFTAQGELADQVHGAIYVADPSVNGLERERIARKGIAHGFRIPFCVSLHGVVHDRDAVAETKQTLYFAIRMFLNDHFDERSRALRRLKKLWDACSADVDL